MSFMPYVSPDQLMKDRSEYAHKGIARGRSVIGMEYQDGLLFLAENPSATLHKISEIYDQMAFAGVGKYSEFEDLRIAGQPHDRARGRGGSRPRSDAVAAQEVSPPPRHRARQHPGAVIGRHPAVAPVPP